MTGRRVFISGLGLISVLGTDLNETRAAFDKGLRGIRPLDLFPTPDNQPLPVGEIRGLTLMGTVPRTHRLARIAARQALAGVSTAPDAVVVGTTTGGMLTTERLLKERVSDPDAYRFHSPASVAEDIAAQCGCRGPVLTVSTACSSGAVAIKIALELIRSGKAGRVLAGGADALCRLIYYGFNALQLIDSMGARPLDRDRRGMTVAEGAAMLLLEGGDFRKSAVEILGAGLSCDAFHPTAPHPEGKGALAAMRSALGDAGLTHADIDYINLHGTGTPDNDLSEARAVGALFKHPQPPLSSIKGAMGHSLAAAGAIEAVIAASCVRAQWIPGNSGLKNPDPELKLDPVRRTQSAPVGSVLSNSFGFGGNNASVVIGRAITNDRSNATGTHLLMVTGSACITGAGHTRRTLQQIFAGKSCRGMLLSDDITRDLSPKRVRRLQRLPRLALALAGHAHANSGDREPPGSIFFGTGWGALSETHRFLTRLFENDEKFPGPTDFIGSVHNAPAGQVAMMFDATGANVTTTGGDYSFEQALMVAGLLCQDNGKTALVMGADENHENLSCLLDKSVMAAETPSDGGGALLVKPVLAKPGGATGGISIHLAFYGCAESGADIAAELVHALGMSRRINTRFGFVLAGIPGACSVDGDRQLRRFREISGFKGPVIDYRKITGEFSAASAVAAVAAVRLTESGKIPKAFCGDRSVSLNGKGGLVLGLGRWVTAMEVQRR
jgi:3-oxoacyl-[acyl-carrier-protein] synthase-1/3-oxoacyl-[acyl-carrier-protein] synthase II